MKKWKVGRPTRAEGPAFPRDVVIRILVQGELVPQAAGPPRREFPGPRALAARYGVSPSSISRFAKRLRLAEARQSWLEQLAIEKCNASRDHH